MPLQEADPTSSFGGFGLRYCERRGFLSPFRTSASSGDKTGNVSKQTGMKWLAERRSRDTVVSWYCVLGRPFGDREDGGTCLPSRLGGGCPPGSRWLSLRQREAQYAGKITFQPGLIALCVTIVVIREAVRSSNWVSGLITGVAIFGSYLALTKDLKVPVTERNLLIILGALVFASAFIGLVIAFFGTSISKTRNFNSRSRRQRPR